ncbi:hypothetical protein BD779DRAFT_1042872 [Infundibulicybe gibba]|nr:hypothetical protein BD779DRAFT_1042872 [Infundibulicybe gibba]
MREPLPPYASKLLANRLAVYKEFPQRGLKEWRHCQSRVPLIQRILSWRSSPYLPDTPEASFYRLYKVFRGRLDNPVPQRARIFLEPGVLAACQSPQPRAKRHTSKGSQGEKGSYGRANTHHGACV